MDQWCWRFSEGYLSNFLHWAVISYFSIVVLETFLIQEKTKMANVVSTSHRMGPVILFNTFTDLVNWSGARQKHWWLVSNSLFFRYCNDRKLNKKAAGSGLAAVLWFLCDTPGHWYFCFWTLDDLWFILAGNIELIDHFLDLS